MNALEAYLLDCQWREVGPKTRDLYKRQVSCFQEFASGFGDKPTLMKFLAQFPNARTRHGYWRAIRAFIRWCARNGLCEDYTAGMTMRWIDAPAPRVLTREQVDALIESMPRTLRGLRDRAILALMFYCGLRRGGALTARRDDLDLSRRCMHVITKGQQELTVTIPTQAARHLSLWMLRAPASPWVFPSLKRPEKPVDARHVSRTIHGLSSGEDGPARIYCHLMRHSHAHALADADVPLQVIQADLGHSNVATTMRYLRGMSRAAQVGKALDRVFS